MGGKNCSECTIALALQLRDTQRRGHRLGTTFSLCCHCTWSKLSAPKQKQEDERTAGLSDAEKHIHIPQSDAKIKLSSTPDLLFFFFLN